MARRLVEETPGIRELKQFELANVKFTGKELGTGSYGSVEVVEIPGASCAAKTIHQVLIQSVAQQIGRQERRGRGYVPRSIIEGFVTECTLMSTLRHPHIVQFLGICYPPGAQLPALVMELLLTSLHKMLESTDDIPMSIKNSILRDVARGLVFLHSLDPSVIHRDLTASNVLVDSSLTAKISDLGMARLLNIQAGGHAATMTKGPGNASYMPPEAKDGDVTKYGKPIDTFSMGNLILFTATQEIPDPINPTFYDPKSRSTKARTEIERRVNSFHILWKMFGKEHPLVLLAKQCLQDNPEIRPTAPEILQRLDMMPRIPYRDWDTSKINLVQDVLEKEQRIAKLEDCLVEQEKKVVKLHNQYAQSSQQNDSQLDPTHDHRHNRSQLQQLKLDDGATQVKRHPPRDSAMTEEVVILINDCLGTKLPGKLGRLIPRLSNPRPHNVLRGELLVPLKNKHSSQNDGPPQPNYFVKMDPNIILYCKAEEVSPLDRRESRFLEGIESTYQRHALFIEGTKTEWGLTLVVSDTVYASIPGPNPVVRKCATANIRYIGEVKGLSGYQFGIEILDDASRGNGTSDGTFKGTRYFQCKEKCGLFVSLDKLSLNPIPVGVQGQRQKTAATTYPSYASALGSGSSGPPSNDSGSGAFQNTSASQNPISENSPMLRENVPTPDYRTKPPVIVQHHVAAVVSSPQPSHWQPLDIGSTIQIPSTEYGHPMRYGVIRWIGELPGVQGLIAGVELDEEMEGCADGTWSTTGQAYFRCPPGKGLYYSLYNLKPDSRFNSASSIPLNPLAEAPDFEENDQALTDPSRQIDKYFGEGRGIQGHQNSCYLDATVFGLFALSSEFDDMFLEETSDPIRNQIRSMLWKGIVNPLRKNGVVKYESVMRLRKKLEELEKMKGITEDEKDPEEFLNMLFKHTLQITPFISIKRPFGVEQEFFVQLFLEFDESMKLPSVGDLLKKMFKEQSISFTEVPPKLLIQVPRFGKQFKTFEKVVPASTLNIADVVDIACAHLCYNCEKPTKTKCMDCKKEFQEGPDAVVYFCDDCCKTVHSVERRKKHQVSCCDEVQSLLQVSELELLSVICIETSHYVCFTRCEDRWVFFDSMANRVHDQFNIPKVVECTHVLNDWIYPANGDLSRLLNTPSRELPEYVRRFTQDVYLCIYIQPDVGMY